jgi:hypothetical protein
MTNREVEQSFETFDKQKGQPSVLLSLSEKIDDLLEKQNRNHALEEDQFLTYDLGDEFDVIRSIN